MTVVVNLEDLVDAMEDASESLNYFVDRETGDVVLVSDTLGFIEAGYQRIEMAKARGRYEPVPVAASSNFSGDLEVFIDKLSDEALAESLEEALDELDAKKAVEVILADRPEVFSEWMIFRADRAKERAVAWLGNRGIAPEPPG